jgi:hypothetical protein
MLARSRIRRFTGSASRGQKCGGSVKKGGVGPPPNFTGKNMPTICLPRVKNSPELSNLWGGLLTFSQKFSVLCEAEKGNVGFVLFHAGSILFFLKSLTMSSVAIMNARRIVGN